LWLCCGFQFVWCALVPTVPRNFHLERTAAKLHCGFFWRCGNLDLWMEVDSKLKSGWVYAFLLKVGKRGCCLGPQSL
jgi:hypothetical protein